MSDKQRDEFERVMQVAGLTAKRYFYRDRLRPDKYHDDDNQLRWEGYQLGQAQLLRELPVDALETGSACIADAGKACERDDDAAVYSIRRDQLDNLIARAKAAKEGV